MIKAVIFDLAASTPMTDSTKKQRPIRDDLRWDAAFIPPTGGHDKHC